MAKPLSLILQLDGTFRAADGSGREIAGLFRRAQGLLAYLATLPDMRAERGLLADLLWSDRSEEQARASLRQELSALRRALPEGALEANRQHVALVPGQVSRQPGRGVFLQGFDLRSEAFEEWLREMRSAEREARDPPPAPQRSSRERPALAVLPFDPLAQSEDTIFADGIVEEITGALSRVHDFHVIARQSAFALRGEKIGIPEAAARLGVDYIVEGSVRRAGDRVRISAQLVSGESGRMVWSERFDEQLDDLFELQDRVAAQVAGQISPNLRAAEIDRARTHAPSDRTAYELVLTALPHFWAHTRADNTRALALLDHAVAASPDYGPALAYKAWVHAQQAGYMWSDDPAGDRHNALNLCRLAARHVSDHAPSLVAMGAAVALASTELELSNSFIDRALSIDPNNAWGWLRRGWNRNYAGITEEGRACFDRAEALSPLDPFRFNMEMGRGGSCMRDKRYEEALIHLRRGMAMSPEAPWGYRVIAVANIHLGRMEEAVEALRNLLDAYPGLTIRKLAASMPPVIIENQPEYYDALRAAGLPEG